MDSLRIQAAFELLSFLHPDNKPGPYRHGPWVVNDDLHLIHTLRGGGTAWIGRRRIRMSREGVLFVPPYVEYRVRPSEQEGLEMLNVHFHLFLEGGVPLTRSLRLPPCFRPPNMAARRRELVRWYALWRKGDVLGRGTVAARVHALIMHYLRAFGAPCAGRREEDPEMNLLRGMLREKPRTAFDAEACAAAVYLSVSQMNRRFRRAYGTSPKECWLRHRYLRARSRLHYGAQSVAEVARLLGFEDANYFSRWFKQMSGLAPRAYREKIRAAGVSRL